MKSARNIPASVRQQLLNRAKTDRRPFNELLQYYAMERFLYRLSLSVHAERFILKGALMLRIWRSPGFRPTMDIDMLGITSNKEAEIIRQIQDILIEDVEPDGLDFDRDSIQCERITEDGNYEGIRLRFQGKLGKARIHMQLDIGFGDAVYPKPEKLKFPTILDFPAPYLLCYSRESSIAEKFEAMDQLMDYHREHGGISRFKKFEWFYREVVKAPLSDEMMDTLCDRFTQLCINAVLDVPMVDGAKESLELLSGRLPMFVASGTPEKELQDILIQRGLAPYFKGIHGIPPEK